jgi:hypothetical protein
MRRNETVGVVIVVIAELCGVIERIGDTLDGVFAVEIVGVLSGLAYGADALR